MIPSHACISASLFHQLNRYHSSPETTPSLAILLDSQEKYVHPIIFLHPLSRRFPSLNRKKFLKEEIDRLEKISVELEDVNLETIPNCKDHAPYTRPSLSNFSKKDNTEIPSHVENNIYPTNYTHLEKVEDQSEHAISKHYLTYVDYMDDLYQVYMDELTSKSLGNRFGYRIYWTKLIGVEDFDSLEELQQTYEYIICIDNSLNTGDWRALTWKDFRNGVLYIPLICRAGEQFRNVGLSIWEAQYLLMEFFHILPDLEPKDTILWQELIGNTKKKLNILELGSGVGLTGIYLQSSKPFSKFINNVHLSDYQEIIIDNISNNLNISQSQTRVFHFKTEKNQVSEEIQSNERNKQSNCKENVVSNPLHCEPILLDWTNYDISKLREYEIDMVLGADIVYDIKVVEPLCDLISDLYSLNPDLKCYFFITRRRESTFKYFRDKMQQRSIHCIEYNEKILPLMKENNLLFAQTDLYDRASVRIFQLQKR